MGVPEITMAGQNLFDALEPFSHHGIRLVASSSGFRMKNSTPSRISLSRGALFFATAFAAALLAFAPRSALAQTVTTLHVFSGGTTDGDVISAPLVQGSDGTIYGVTRGGGANGNGTVFKTQPDGSGYQLLFSFPASSDSSPRGPSYALILGRDGVLYGTTQTGGSLNLGSLYKINRDGSGYTVLRSFGGARDGVNLQGGLLQASDGNLYGLTSAGSASSTVNADGSGTIYKIAPDGSGYQVIFSFNGSPNYPNGLTPNTLIQARDGNLYGTAQNGGANTTAQRSPGTIFTLKTDGSDFKVLFSFDDRTGQSPRAPLVQTSDGTLYGTTSQNGGVFRINPDGTDYRAVSTAIRTSDSFFQGLDGSLYGRTRLGGLNPPDLIYKVRPDGSGYREITRAGGGFLWAALIQGLDGALYGSAETRNGNTVVYSLVRVVEAPGVVITQQPRSQTIAPGGNVTFTVTATGATTYQWRRNGTAIPGATLATLTLNNLTTAANGTYTVIASSATDSATSSDAVLLVAAPNPGRLVNLSVRTTAGAGAQTLIAGFVVGGTGSKQVLVRAIGPTLTAFGVTGALADPQLGLFNASSTQIATNTVWGGGAALTNAFASVGAFALGATSRDAALLAPLTASGASGYSAQVVSASGGTGVALVEAYDADGATSTARFINLSARTVAGTGAQTLIAGFVLSGNVPKTLLIRGVGPGLNQFGLTGTLANPRLELHTTVNSADVTVAANAGWGGTPALTAAFAQVGAFNLPATSADAVLLVSLQPGSYTAQVSGVGGTTGIALVEVYEVP